MVGIFTKPINLHILDSPNLTRDYRLVRLISPFFLTQSPLLAQGSVSGQALGIQVSRRLHPNCYNMGLTNLGFLTVLHEASGYLGGYLVTNIWGRPLEFRLTSAVQPNRVQHVLYAGTLEPYICADLIGKTLVDKAAVPVQLLLTDRASVLDLRLKLECPVVWLASTDDAQAAALAQRGLAVTPAQAGQGPLLCHPRFPEDVTRTRDLLGDLDAAFDLAEPFGRIREAIGEARKMGVHK
jgi:hypothetical protein